VELCGELWNFQLQKLYLDSARTDQSTQCLNQQFLFDCECVSRTSLRSYDAAQNHLVPQLGTSRPFAGFLVVAWLSLAKIIGT